MTANASASLDLDAYLARIDYSGDLLPTAATLSALHLAHVTHVPFESLDLQLGRLIHLDLDSVQAKLVHGKRGGYCFEQNTLFAAVLERLGFRVTPLAARVRFGNDRVLPRTHMLLKVDVDGIAWLADVGFGGVGLLQPLLLTPGLVARQFAWSYRVVQENADVWVLQALHQGAWSDYYAFALERQHAVDYEVANWYTSTHPSSRFVQTLIAQRATPEARYILRNREFTVDRGEESTTRTIDDGELLSLLAETFGLAFPAGTQFRARP